MAKKKETQTLVLADYWNPPDGIEVRLDVGEPEICLATTYEFDATFFETVLLPRFLGLRFDNTEKESIFLLEREQALYTTQVMVLVDRAKYDPGQSTQRYQQLPVYVPGGKQHAKMSLLVWQHCVRLLVASANLTKSGYRNNREIFSAIDFFNDATSAPEKLLKDALDFAERLCAFADPEHPVTENALKAIQEVRNKIARWRNMPADFSPREKPRATLVYGHPAHPNFPAASPLDQLLKLWNNRRADSVWIVTPFAGTTSPGEDPVLKKIATLPRRQNAQVILAIPQEEFHKEQKKHAVPIAKDFGQSYQELFEKRGLVLPIPRLVENKDEKPRELHAKAIIVQNSEHTLFFCGSSNFTPHGMGVEVFNCECNIAFEDATGEFRSGKSLASRMELPLGWEKAVSCDRIIWKASIDTTTIVDDNVGLLAPLFFGLATYSQNTGILRIPLNFNFNQPPKFGIYVQDGDNSLRIFTQQNLDPQKNYLECILDEKRRSNRITA
ncbi:MAG: hypothetical protein NZL89_06445, partial [Leptospiraceae bacterium]|nr:hypothetical protein [Leptospiraceae bacterium]